LHAATIMAELRHATRAYLTEGHGPAAVIDRLNTMMQMLVPGEIATMCLISIEVATGAAVLANAGHPPPVLSSPAGARLITEHTPLLGISVRAAVDVDFVLDRGATLVLYTDGLIETRAEDLDHGFGRLTDAASCVEPDLEAFASRLLADVGPADPSDDIAMVVVRRPM
jgi:serine phosphatase RsbU (regulator of sigma subunit)